MKKIQGLILLLGVVFLSGCKSTQLSNVWRDANFNNKYENLAVIAFIDDYDARTIVETQIVSIFENNGIRMTKANVVVREGDNITPEMVEKALKERGIDGVLILRPISVDRDVMVDPGVYAVYPGWGGYFYGGYYPPSVSTTTTFQIHNELYDVATTKMVWSAQTSTVNPGDIQTIGQGIGDAVLYSLRDNGLIVVPEKK